MKTLTKILSSSIMFLGMMSAVFAAASPKTFSIYVINKTPYKVTLGVSNYSNTPVNLTNKEVSTSAAPVLVATGDIVNGKADISVYARIGEERNYRNTPLFGYKLTDTYQDEENYEKAHFVGIYPNPLVELPYNFSDGKKYRANAYYFVDSQHGDNNALMIVFEPALS